MSDQEGALQEEPPPPPPYIIFVVVFLFFVTGLCGFLVCHLLKLKGYRCTMEEDEEDEDELEEQAQDDDSEENQDTVEQILKCIIENEANMEAFNEMLGKGNVCVRHDPRLRKESIGGVPPHMHTVHSGSDLHNTCHLCAQSRSKRGRRPSRTPRFRQRPGEQTVFSVGRFRVTHTDKKISDGSGRVPDVLVGSGDQLDRSLDSDGGYNLRNMFKDVRSPSEGLNGVAPNAGKRRRSLTIFGLRRGSDPIGVKVVGAGREVRFVPQPVVLEEPQTENGENGSKDVSKVRSESLGIEKPPVEESSKASAIKAMESSSRGAKDTRSPVTSPPDSLPMSLASSPKPSGSVNEHQALLSPGPLQTSTPLSLLPNPGEGIGQFQAEASVPQSLPGSQTPPDPCTSPVLEHDSFTSPALISLGSSPHSSIRTPTSPSPKISAKTSLQPASTSLRSGSPARSSSQTSSPTVSLAAEGTSQDPRLKSSTRQSTPELKNVGTPEGDQRSPPSRVSSVTVVKASPDSQREFSVVTMVDEKAGAPAADDGAAPKWTLGDEKDDMMEMEEIAECRVTQAGDVGENPQD